MRILVLLALVSILSAQPPTAASQVEGIWVGALDTGAMKLRLAFHLKADGTGTFDSLDQGAKGLPIESVKLDGKHVSMVLKSVHGTYEAELMDDGQTMQGLWKQGQPIPLALTRSASMPETKRPQTPQPPFPYKREEVTYSSVNKGVTLAATLTIPDGPGPFPGVVMITGSGPQDRDESIMGHQPFWVIADYFSRHGIAVLRADDRGIGKSTGIFAKATTPDFADDAEGGVLYLKTRTEISRIGLVGHSEGGIIAPIIANRNPEVKFLILMAGTAVPGDQLMFEQNRRVMKSMGLPDSFAESQVQRLKEIIRVEKQEPDPKLAAEKALKALGEIDPALKPTVDAQIAQTATPWFHWFLSYDPGPALRGLKQPVLVLNGSLDVQVPADQNIPVMTKLLDGNHDHKILTLQGLNHLFQHAKTGSPQEYSSIEETISPEVLSVMAEWIGRHAH